MDGRNLLHVESIKPAGSGSPAPVLYPKKGDGVHFIMHQRVQDRLFVLHPTIHTRGYTNPHIHILPDAPFSVQLHLPLFAPKWSTVKITKRLYARHKVFRRVTTLERLSGHWALIDLLCSWEKLETNDRRFGQKGHILLVVLTFISSRAANRPSNTGQCMCVQKGLAISRTW